MMKKFAILIALAVSACVTVGPSTTPLGRTPADQTYQKFDLTGDGHLRERPTTVYFKREARDGKLVLCGYYVPPDDLISQDLLRVWFSEMTITLDGQPIASGNFMLAQPNKFGRHDNIAACVRTEVDAAKGMSGAIKFEGNIARVSY